MHERGKGSFIMRVDKASEQFAIRQLLGVLDGYQLADMSKYSRRLPARHDDGSRKDPIFSLLL